MKNELDLRPEEKPNPFLYQENKTLGGATLGFNGQAGITKDQNGASGTTGAVGANLGYQTDGGTQINVAPQATFSNVQNKPQEVSVGDVNTTKVGAMTTTMGVGASVQKDGFKANGLLNQNGDIRAGAGYQTTPSTNGTTLAVNTSYQNVGGKQAFGADALASFKTDDLQESLGVSLGRNDQETTIGGSGKIGTNINTGNGFVKEINPYATANASTTLGGGSVFDAAKANVGAGVNVVTKGGTIGGGITQSLNDPRDRKIYSNVSFNFGGMRSLNPF